MRRPQRSLLRTGRPMGLVALLCFLMLPNVWAHQESSLATKQTRGEIRLLEAGRLVEGELNSQAGHTYELALSEGQFLHLTLRANAITNIQLTLIDPDGGTLEERSGPECPVALFSLYLLATRSGTYRLQLDLSRGAPPEPYKLQIDELRAASDQDKTRSSASQALVEACRLSAQESPAAEQQSNQKFQKAMDLFLSVKDDSGEAEVFQVRGFRSFAARDYEGAVESLRQADLLWHALADTTKEAGVLEDMAESLARVGRSQERLDSLNQALHLRQTLNDLWAEATDSDRLGDTYNEMGEFQEALSAYARALSLYRAAANSRVDDEIEVLVDLGHVYGELGDSQKALDYDDQALRLARSHGNRGLEMDLLRLVADAYGEAGYKDAAFENYNKAVALAKGNLGDEAFKLGGLADFYMRQEEYEKAVRVFDRILPYFHAQHLAQFEAPTLYSKGVAYSKLGKPQQALEALNGALSIWPFKNDVRHGILLEIGDVYLDSGESRKALEFYEKALTESRAANNLQGEASALCGLAHAERSLQQIAQARRDIEAGLQLFESQRARIAGAESRASYFAAVQKNYDFYIDLLMQMHAEHPDQDLDAVALQASERAHARSLLDLLLEAHADVHEGADPTLLERERTLQQRLRARSLYQVQLLARSDTAPQAEAVNYELQTLTAEYDETEAQIRATSPRYASLTQPVPLDLKQIQEQVLDSDTLLLEYALGEDRSYLWAVTSSSLTSFTLPKRAEVEKAARRVYELLAARNKHPKGEGELERETRIARARAQYPSAAAGLSEMVLSPAAALLSHKRLLVVADGALQYIPFAALPTPRQGTDAGLSQPLVVESEIVNAPSASTLAVLKRDLNGRQPAEREVAVLADPVFDGQDPRVSALQPVSQHLPAAGSISRHRDFPTDVERSWTDAGVTEQGWKIPRLPFSRREAQAIVAAAPQGTSFEAVDFHATRATAMSSDLAQYRVIHFATHGVLDSRTPALSGIILSLVDQRGRPQDGFLRLWDIYNLHLSADLVVLSACQTALGKDVKGEGLVGLTRGFMYAGAKRVMASLWQVDDAATAELMSKFYRSYLKANMPPAAALRAAQVYMWKQTRWHDPYFWGAFQIQGGWN